MIKRNISFNKDETCIFESHTDKGNYNVEDYLLLGAVEPFPIPCEFVLSTYIQDKPV